MYESKRESMMTNIPCMYIHIYTIIYKLSVINTYVMDNIKSFSIQKSYLSCVVSKRNTRGWSFMNSAIATIHNEGQN